MATLVELLQDANLILHLGVDSRLYWTLLSIVGYRGKCRRSARSFESQEDQVDLINEAEQAEKSSRSSGGDREPRDDPQAKVWNLELPVLLPTFTLSVILIGWRQRWWLCVVSVDEATARRAARECIALSLLFLGFVRDSVFCLL